MGKTQGFSRGNSVGFVPQYRHADNMGESEGLGSSGCVDSEDSCEPKRKSVYLDDIDGKRNSRAQKAPKRARSGSEYPSQLISLSKLTPLERRNLEMTLRGELQRVQMLQKKIFVNDRDDVCVPSSNVNRVMNGLPAVQNPSQLNRGKSGRFESKKQAPSAIPSSNTNMMLMKQCETLLKRLMSHQYAWVFNKPVDVVKLKLTDYYDVIKHPMDLGTIKRNLDSGVYSSPHGFVSDVRLTFTNAMTYNPPGTDVHIMADTLSKFFEVRWKSVEKKLNVPDSELNAEKEGSKPESQPKKLKDTSNPTSVAFDTLKNEKQNMTIQDKHRLSQLLESLIAELPDHIIEFLRRHSGANNQINEDEMEIDFETLNDDTLFELQRLLDAHLSSRGTDQQREIVNYEVEANDSGLSNSCMQPARDIARSDAAISSFSHVEIENNTGKRSSKQRNSGSVSSSGSKSDAAKASSPVNTVRDVKKLEVESALDPGRSDIMSPVDLNRPVEISDLTEPNVEDPKASFDNNIHEEGMSTSQRQVSPGKLYRAALLRSRFADTILKAREKTLGKSGNADPEKLRKEREELERIQKEEKARLLAEAKAAEDAHKRAEAAAAAEARRKRELEREAARQALLMMEKTVEINENSQFLKDLEMLGTAPTEHVPSSVDETSPEHSCDGMGGFKLSGINPLEQLGLFMKIDDEDEEEVEPSNQINDAEEGEID